MCSKFEADHKKELPARLSWNVSTWILVSICIYLFICFHFFLCVCVCAHDKCQTKLYQVFHHSDEVKRQEKHRMVKVCRETHQDSETNVCLHIVIALIQHKLKGHILSLGERTELTRQ